MPEWLKGADCKSASASLRWFESSSAHHFVDLQRESQDSLFLLLFLRVADSFRISSHRSDFLATPLRMSDSISALTRTIQSFVDERDWRQFHNPKDLAVAIAAEAGELMQHFVWQQDAQLAERIEKHRADIASEVADVAILLFEFADNLGMNLGEIMEAKIAYNQVRYPVEKSRGNNRKYNEL